MKTEKAVMTLSGISGVGPFISLDVNGPTDTKVVRLWCL